MVEDTSPGVHDTVIAACDPIRYQQLGAKPDHRSCCTNFAEALAELSIVRNTPVPAPLNLFMNIPWDLEGNITFEPTVSAPGDSVLFRAEVDAIVVASACPQDMVPINGPGGGTPVDVELVSSADQSLDVDHHVGVDGAEDTELTRAAGRHNGAVGDDRAGDEVEIRDGRHGRAAGIQREEAAADGSTAVRLTTTPPAQMSS